MSEETYLMRIWEVEFVAKSGKVYKENRRLTLEHDEDLLTELVLDDIQRMSWMTVNNGFTMVKADDIESFTVVPKKIKRFMAGVYEEHGSDPTEEDLEEYGFAPEEIKEELYDI